MVTIIGGDFSNTGGPCPPPWGLLPMVQFKVSSTHLTKTMTQIISTTSLQDRLPQQLFPLICYLQKKKVRNLFVTFCMQHLQNQEVDILHKLKAMKLKRFASMKAPGGNSDIT